MYILIEYLSNDIWYSPRHVLVSCQLQPFVACVYAFTCRLPRFIVWVLSHRGFSREPEANAPSLQSSRALFLARNTSLENLLWRQIILLITRRPLVKDSLTFRLSRKPKTLDIISSLVKRCLRYEYLLWQ